MQLSVRVRVSNPNSVVFGLILTIMTRFPRRVWVQNRYEPVQTGLNRFHVVFFFFSGTFERRHGMREKRNRACKLCDAYCLVALYLEPFDVFRFASTSTYRLFHNESAKNNARSKGQGQQNKHRRFLERSNEVTPFHPASRLKSSGRKFVHAAGKTREKSRKSTSSANFQGKL